MLNEKQRQVAKDNYAGAVQSYADPARISRRQMLTGALAIPTVAGLYWGYNELQGNKVKVGVIGTGDQGNNGHILPMNTDFCELVAFSDIRPSSIQRTWENINNKFGADVAKKVKFYADYDKLLDDPEIEMVSIALPLHLHAEATIKALKKGKHVICEKLMAHNVMQCKQMIRTADETKKLLAIGHQRHYSYLYANCRSLIEQGSVLGDIRYIRACWHRNQTDFGAP
ncbi:MAG: Gfo/Idh/MocA family oxidoreductase, partial [Phycisphaerae bacterium]|nr:Gfo/Idh/MocA family oxidoreductase [Phycisphaerae bacterium]